MDGQIDKSGFGGEGRELDKRTNGQLDKRASGHSVGWAVSTTR